MGAFDAEKLGLKCGLEIHQQLGRPGDKKLFCRCPAEIVERDPDVVVKRQLKASAGETGSVDVAARAEQAKRKEYVYHSYNDTTCLVEIDEEPPHPVNQDVMKTAVMVAKILNSTMMPTVQFMRKTIVDGSNVSGFQRTGLFAVGGTIPHLDPEVRIQSICIEEESAKIISRDHEQDIYNLSRLGIPLLEIATAPDIKTPEQAKEVAAQLGMILRSTHRVKRGLGTIRQDLNVSIVGGNRCELKGVQDLRTIPQAITNEALRQQGLVELKKELEGKELRVSDIIDVTKEFKKSDVGFVKKALGKAIGISVTHFKGLLGKELCPGYRVGTELAGLAKTGGFGGIIHSDEDMKKYGVNKNDLANVFGLDKTEAFIVLLGDEKRITSLFETTIIPRIHNFTEGVPMEVRKALPDGTSSYLRPVPGAARMYPETDVPLVKVNTNIEPPKLLSEQVTELMQETGLSKDLATHILTDDIPIKKFKERFSNLSFNFLCSALVEWPKEIATRVAPLDSDVIEPLLVEVDAGNIGESSVKTILEHAAKDRVSASEILKIASQYKQLSDEELITVVDEVVKNNPGARENALMGQVMAKVRGKADGKRIMTMLKERV